MNRVIPAQSRARYMAALEAASVDQDIRPFAAMLDDQIHNANQIETLNS